MILIAISIKLASRGPVFYRARRVGFKGRMFTMLKFRSMKHGAETLSHEEHWQELVRTQKPITKLDAMNDPRLIPGGRLLRATGLDELPQLLNVILGQMSLVGPRPCSPSEYNTYEDWQKERVNAPPGLTGYWQVNGKNKTTFNQMIEMDIHYGKRMSVLLDFAILLGTPPAMALQVVEATWRNESAEASVTSKENSLPPAE